jgi:hypothetical protein
MADHQTLVTAKTPDRLPVIWTIAEKRVSDLKFDFPAKIAPDLKKLQEKMGKSGKPADFVIEFKGNKFSFKMVTGSDTTLLAQVNFAAEKDLATRRKWLQSLRDRTDLVSNADLAKFDKDNPPPPDPAEVAKQRQIVKTEMGRIKIEQEIANGLPKKWKDVPEGQREIGFKNWGKSKGIAPWIEFLTAADNGRSVESLVKDFLDPSVTPPLRMRPETRRGIDDAIKAGKKPDLSRLKTEIEQMLDSGFVAKSSAEAKKSIEDNIKDRKVRATAAAEKLKAMGVKP